MSFLELKVKNLLHLDLGMSVDRGGRMEVSLLP